MNGDLLLHGRPSDVDAYMRKKYETWRGWRYRKSERISKALSYYAYASSPAIKAVIKEAYEDMFNEEWPTAELTKLERRIQEQESQHKVPRDVALKSRKRELAKASSVRKRLNMIEQRGATQEGERFMLELTSLAGPVLDKGAFDRTNYSVENRARGVAALTGSASKGKNIVEAQFDCLAGISAKSELEFQFDGRLATQAVTLAASLNSEFKAGVWGAGSVKAHLSKTGLDASAAVALAFGMDCRVEGQSTWKVNDVGVVLSGGAKLFAGAKASAKGSLNINREGLAASLSAKAFAGVKASCTGTVALQYADKDLVSASATGSFTFGVGAAVEASVQSSFFGPTQISFGADLALGLGVGASTSTAIHFTKIGLAASAEFRKLALLPSIIEGYSTKLQDDQRGNEHWLAKAKGLLDDLIEERSEMLESLHKVPEETQSFLLSLG